MCAAGPEPIIRTRVCILRGEEEEEGRRGAAGMEVLDGVRCREAVAARVRGRLVRRVKGWRRRKAEENRVTEGGGVRGLVGWEYGDGCKMRNGFVLRGRG